MTSASFLSVLVFFLGLFVFFVFFDSLLWKNITHVGTASRPPLLHTDENISQG